MNINPYAAGSYFCQYKIMQKTWKITETLANGYSSKSTQWGLSNEYQHDRVFKNAFLFFGGKYPQHWNG